MSIFKKKTLEPEVQKKKGKLAIIVGHQKTAPGASSEFGLSEYKFHTQHVVPIMEKECQEIGLEYKVFLRDGTDIGGVGKAVSMWADKETVAIELHFNAADGSARGSEVLYDSLPEKNKAFADAVLARIINALGTVNRGIKLMNSGRGAHNLTSVTCVGCLVEPFFGDNKKDASNAFAKKEEYAKALVQVAKHFIDSQL